MPDEISNTTPAGANPTAVIGDRSDGQRLLDRLMAAHTRIGDIGRKVDELAVSVHGRRRQLDAEPPAVRLRPKATSFFAALELLAQEFETAADELDAAVSHMAELF